jgi:transposase-like protein
VSQFSAGQNVEEEGPAGGLLEGAEGERKQIAGGVGRPEGVADPELAPRASRRRFSAAYKLKIVIAADACTKPGDVGALLRGEGLYSSLLTEWRRARDSGALGALEPRQRGPKPPSADRVHNAALRRELERTQADLQTARRVIEVQGNVSALLEELLAKSAPAPTSEQRPTS